MEKSKVHLRSMTLADTNQIIAWRNSDFVRKNFLYQEPFTKEIHENWFRTQVCTGQAEQFIICTEEQQEIGSVYLRDIDYDKRCAEYGVYIGEQEALGKGYGFASARVMLKYAFEILGLQHIYLRVLEDNEAARRCYARVGFRIISQRAEKVELIQGVRNVLFMEIKSEDWYE